MVEKCTQDYFDREKQLWFDVSDYLDADENLDGNDKLDKARVIIGDDVDQYIAYEKDDDGNEMIDLFNTDREGIDQAIRDYNEPLCIKKYVSVEPYSNEIIDTDDCIYEIWLCVGGPGVFFHIDTTAELVVNWGGDHLTWNFGRDMAETILNFYGLE